MRKLRDNFFLLSASLLVLFFLLLVSFLANKASDLNRAFYDLPRLVLNLERSIGFDGFIHNFKNGVLRPGEGYFEKAFENYEDATLILQKISKTSEAFGLIADLGKLEETVDKYQEMIAEAERLQKDGKSIAEVDAAVKVPDGAAADSIRDFERELSQAMQTRRSIVVGLGLAFIFAIVISVLAFAYFQMQMRKSSETSRRIIRERESVLLQAERIAKLGHWKVEKDGRLQISDSMRNILKISKYNMPENLEQLFSKLTSEDRIKIEREMAKSARLKKEYTCFHKISTGEGAELTVVNSGEPIVDNLGEVCGFVGVMQDVSKVAELENELRQAQKMEAIGNLAGGMAHDFNNILGVILGNLELLETSQEPEKLSRYRSNAIQAAKRGAEVTRNVLSFARKSHLEPKMLDGNEIVKEVLNWSERLLPASIDVQTSLIGSVWPFMADDALTKSALLNLLLNARDAMPEGGRLTIETANIRLDEEYLEDRAEFIEAGHYVMIAVSDTGVGISPQHISNIFDPFFSTKRVGEGSGLGLSMVHGFMKQSDGAVRVYSEPGSGTTFKLLFRAQPGNSPLQVLPIKRDSIASGKGARVLLAEDNLDLLRPLEEILVGAGYEVVTAQSGDEAFMIWSAQRNFDAVVTDIVMPGTLQGTHLAKEIRKVDSTASFVFMSGFASEAMIHGNGLKPEDLRLMKPVSRSQLLAAVSSIIKQSKELTPDL